MRSRRPTENELPGIFERSLALAVDEGRGVSCTGLDTETDDALFAIMRAHPDVPGELVERARRAFAGQLDGSNAAARRARLEERFREHGPKREETR